MPQASLFPARVARRIVTLFVVCVLVPAAVVSVIVYVQASRELERQAIAQLEERAITAGNMLLDRLRLAAAELEVLVSGDVPGAPGGARLVDLAGVVPLADSGPAPPHGGLDPSAERHLATGRPVLLVAGEHPTGLVLVRDGVAPGGGRRRMVGRLRASAFWAFDDARSVPNGHRLCVLDHRDRPLFCPGAAGQPPADAVTRGGGLAWRADGDRVLAAEHAVPLAVELGAPAWRLVVSQPAHAVLAPLGAFRSSLWLLVGLAVVGAFLLGHIQIRRLLAPLRELETGTRRLAAGDLRHRVRVATDDEFGSLAASFNAMAQSLTRQFGTLRTLQDIGRVALTTPDVPAIAETAARAARELTGGLGATLLAATGDRVEPWVRVRLDAADGRAADAVNPSGSEREQLAQGYEYFVIAPGEPEPGYLAGSGGPVDRRLVVFPLRRAGDAIGALALALPPHGTLDDGALRHARMLADQAGVALANAHLLRELDDLSWGALTALARTIDASSPWTAGHSERVTAVSLAIARAMDLSAADQDLLHRGGYLHDVGKIAVPAAILDKADRLTPEERAIIESHPEAGARIVAPIAAFRDVVPLVRWHHEALDGSGYPDGLSGAAIPLVVRVLTVADVFDALVSERPYRAAWTIDDAVAYLRANAGRRFDADVVEAFARGIREDPRAMLRPLPPGPDRARRPHAGRREPATP